ncbi:MAG: hypothetical protein AB7N91_15665 [Candidatus Tectimicrobiota bacterium]
MEFETEREAALYRTLKQVLQNHIVNNRIGYHHTLGACVPVLGYVLSIMSDAGGDAPGAIAETVAELHQRTQTRVLQETPPLPSFHDYSPTPDSSAEGHELGTALATLLTASGIEHDMSLDATWRVMMSLLADVLAMSVHDEAQPPADLEAYIRSLHDQITAVMLLWDEERGEALP